MATTAVGASLGGASNGTAPDEKALSLASRNRYNTQGPISQQAIDDPFTITPGTDHHQTSQRFGHFNSQIIALDSSSSPAQTKRAIEAHLAETERRIHDASRLGTTLVQQRKDLSRSLKEVELQEMDGEIGPELRQKLLEIEKEYHEVGRESARAMLGPKTVVVGAEAVGASPFGARRPTSPSKFQTESHDSPSKLNVPSQRRARNQPADGIHDSEFYAEISTSLLSQVRNLQAIIAERDQNLKTVQLDKSRLEAEAEGFAQRLRSLDESEQRYKDENWSLETQTHELIAANKEAAAREQKLNHALSLVSAEKATAQKELDEFRQVKEKLAEDHSTAVKHHELELQNLRRDLTSRENARSTMQRRIDELNSQNHELAQAVASRMRNDEGQTIGESNEDHFDPMGGYSTPEGSPPPSPSKGTPRHSMLESETLKGSLQHAHRMIQNLKSNIHREKTEKIELKRLLQEARDDLDIRRTEAGATAAAGSGKNSRSKSDRDIFKKPLNPNLLGMGRNAKNEILLFDDVDWEDQHENSQSPSRLAGTGGSSTPGRVGMLVRTESQASEASEAFETANEREMSTDNDAFETGAESLDGNSSEELTETEGGTSRMGGSSKAKRISSQSAIPQAGNRHSFLSTASTSDDEGQAGTMAKTRTAVQQQQRYKLKVHRGAAARRSRASMDDSPAGFKDSPASFVSGGSQGTPQGPSLFAELGDLNGEEVEGEEDGGVEGTPSRGSLRSRTPASSRPGTAKRGQPDSWGVAPPLPKVAMIDSGTMTTETWMPTSTLIPVPTFSKVPMTGSSLDSGGMADRETSRTNSGHLDVPTSPRTVDEQQATMRQESVSTDGSLTSWSIASDDRRGSGPGWSPPRQSTPYPMSMARIGSADIEPVPAVPEVVDSRQALRVSSIYSQTTEPVPESRGASGTKPDRTTVILSPSSRLSYSAIFAQAIEPVAPILQQFISEASAAVVVPSRPNTARDVTPTRGGSRDSSTPEAAKPGFLGSVFGWGKSQKVSEPQIAEDHEALAQSAVIESASPTESRGSPFQDISPNIVRQPGQEKEKGAVASSVLATNHIRPPPVEMTDQSAQTTLSAEQINGLLNAESHKAVSTDAARRIRPASPVGVAMQPIGVVPLVSQQAGLRSNRSQESLTAGSVQRARSRMSEPPSPREDNLTMARSFKRPTSQGSLRNSSGNHPPLPPDHKQAIAAAARASLDQAGVSAMMMGPPTMPASAYPKNSSPSRRATTPAGNGPQSPSIRSGTTPRAVVRHSSTQPSVPRSGRSSPAHTRRSSVSSFASELDERFNIRTDGRSNMAIPSGFGTDPRMIQAITQTMIGEYLWKYTRKAGRSATSDKRHRRYFWVHPYTKTLYWSERDPATAGRAELKAKSVSIQAVRVVTDDNPLPPGLHRKSLVVVTPGRSVKMTATTGGQHETWFNALSYLLLRTTGAGQSGQAAGYGEDVGYTNEEVDEFNPRIYAGSSRRGRSTRGTGAMSVSSMQGSRPPTRHQSISRTSQSRSVLGSGAYGSAGGEASQDLSTSSRTSMPQPRYNSAGYYMSTSMASRTSSQQQQQAQQQAGRISRLSGMFRSSSTFRGSFASRKSRHSLGAGASASIDGDMDRERDQRAYGEEIVSQAHDSAEDLREQYAREDRESDRLENVRACCDGKHDVGHLSHSKRGRHSHSHATRSGSITGRFSTAGSMTSRHSVRAQTPTSVIHHELPVESNEYDPAIRSSSVASTRGKERFTPRDTRY